MGLSSPAFDRTIWSDFLVGRSIVQRQQQVGAGTNRKEEKLNRKPVRSDTPAYFKETEPARLQ